MADRVGDPPYFFMLLLKLSERKSTLEYVLPLFSFSQCVCWFAWERLSASPNRRSRLLDDNSSLRGSSTLATKREGLRDLLIVVSFLFPGASQRGLTPLYRAKKGEVENSGKCFVVCFYFSPHWFFFSKRSFCVFFMWYFSELFWAARKNTATKVLALGNSRRYQKKTKRKRTAWTRKTCKSNSFPLLFLHSHLPCVCFLFLQPFLLGNTKNWSACVVLPIKFKFTPRPLRRCLGKQTVLPRSVSGIDAYRNSATSRPPVKPFRTLQYNVMV